GGSNRRRWLVTSLSLLLVPLKLERVAAVAAADAGAADERATGTASSAEKWSAGRRRAPLANIRAGPDLGLCRAVLGPRGATPRVPGYRVTVPGVAARAV